MTSPTFNPANELRRIIAEGYISEDALEAITLIPVERLKVFLDSTHAGTGLSTELSSLSNDESARLSSLAAQLTEGLRIADDERLKGILESLTVECGLTLQNIAALTGLDTTELQSALLDPRTLSLEMKYEFATRGSYLINVVNQARGR